MRVIALLALAGCTAPASLPEVSIPLRNPTAPVASQVDADLSHLAGDWVVVQGAGLAPGSTLAFDKGRLVVNGASLPVRNTGPGRLVVGRETVWIHWIDADNRTAALGNPDGTRVWIMDRAGKPGERLRAAREILTWYGYDLSRVAG